ncbi:hypothetical protein [Lactococcus phage PMBT68]|nr:hypothetical protein [Lactococcus phage P1411]
MVDRFVLCQNPSYVSSKDTKYYFIFHKDSVKPFHCHIPYWKISSK